MGWREEIGYAKDSATGKTVTVSYELSGSGAQRLTTRPVTQSEVLSPPAVGTPLPVVETIPGAGSTDVAEVVSVAPVPGVKIPVAALLSGNTESSLPPKAGGGITVKPVQPVKHEPYTAPVVVKKKEDTKMDIVGKFKALPMAGKAIVVVVIAAVVLFVVKKMRR